MHTASYLLVMHFVTETEIIGHIPMLQPVQDGT